MLTYCPYSDARSSRTWIEIPTRISLGTVRTHITSIYRKLQVHSVAEAVTRALRDRIV